MRALAGMSGEFVDPAGQELFVLRRRAHKEQRHSVVCVGNVGNNFRPSFKGCVALLDMELHDCAGLKAPGAFQKASFLADYRHVSRRFRFLRRVANFRWRAERVSRKLPALRLLRPFVLWWTCRREVTHESPDEMSLFRPQV